MKSSDLAVDGLQKLGILGSEGFEPPKTSVNRFTVYRVWPLR